MTPEWKLMAYKDGNLCNHYPLYYTHSAHLGYRKPEFGKYDNLPDCIADAKRESSHGHFQILVVGTLDGNRLIIGVATSGNFKETN
jgi:hypothetical protein